MGWAFLSSAFLEGRTPLKSSSKGCPYVPVENADSAVFFEKKDPCKEWGGVPQMRGWGRGLDSPFFSTIVLFENQLFPLGFYWFFEKKDPWKEWGGVPQMRGWGRGLDSPFFSTIVFFENQLFPLGFCWFSEKKDPWKEWGGVPQKGGCGLPWFSFCWRGKTPLKSTKPRVPVCSSGECGSLPLLKPTTQNLL